MWRAPDPAAKTITMITGAATADRAAKNAAASPESSMTDAKSRRPPEHPSRAIDPGIQEDAATLSAVLRRLTDHPADAITVDDLIGHFGSRAFGGLLFIFAVPNLLPLPPGSSTVLGMPLLLIGPQLALGANDPWLPKRIGRRKIRTSVLAEVCRKALPWVQRVERLSSGRLPVLFGGPGERVIGVVCTLLAAVLVLPIPLGNMLPALAIVVLALSLAQRDGALALTGYAMAAASAGVLFLSGHLVVQALGRLGAWIAGW
jgi:hypothetical protein